MHALGNRARAWNGAGLSERARGTKSKPGHIPVARISRFAHVTTHPKFSASKLLQLFPSAGNKPWQTNSRSAACSKENPALSQALLGWDSQLIDSPLGAQSKPNQTSCCRSNSRHFCARTNNCVLGMQRGDLCYHRKRPANACLFKHIKIIAGRPEWFSDMLLILQRDISSPNRVTLAGSGRGQVGSEVIEPHLKGSRCKPAGLKFLESLCSSLRGVFVGRFESFGKSSTFWLHDVQRAGIIV